MRTKIWLGVAVSAVLLWVAVRGVNLDEVLQQLRQVQLVWLIPVLASILVRFWLTALRWQLLLRPAKRDARTRRIETVAPVPGADRLN